MSKRPLMIIFLTVFIDLLGFGIVLPLLPRYAETLHASDLTIGLLLASFSAMQFFFSPIWARISDRVGRRPILMMGLLGSVLFYALFGYGSAIGSMFLLFVARIGAGIAGATIATAQAYIADSTPPEKRTSGMALIGMAFGIGFVFGPLLGAAALAIPVTSSQVLNPYPGYLAALLSLVALMVAVWYLPESLKEGSRAHGRHWLSLGQFQRAMTIPTILPLVLIGFVAVFGFAVFESTLSRFSKDVFDMGDKKNFYLFAYTGVSLLVAQGFVVRRLNRMISDEKMAVSGAVLMLLSMVVLVAALAIASRPLLFVVLPVLVTGFALLNTSVQSMISRRSPADEQGGILGVNQAGSSMARIVGPALGNVLYGKSVLFPYIIASGLLFVVGLLLMWLPKVADEGTVAAGPPAPTDPTVAPFADG